MKKIITISSVFLLIYTICNAGDFIVEFVQENYRETNSPVSYSPVIYHSIQVKSEAGPKLLVLKGDNYHYRKWVRQYIAQGKQFIAQISDDQDDLFISSSAFEMDVTDLHPFNLSFYRQGEQKLSEKKISGNIQKSLSPVPFPGRTPSQIKKKELVKKQVKDKASKDKKRAVLKEKAKKRKEQAKKQAKQDEQLKVEFKKKQLEQNQFLAALEAERAENEQRRRNELEKRWKELKQRLLADERIRTMSLEGRNQEIERRWYELQQRYGF